MKEVQITNIEGIKVGHAHNFEGATGCTVILCEDGAVAGVDVQGGAPGTRETDLLDPVNLVEEVHGVFLAGGSAFGLDCASGVMKYLEERGKGFDVQVAKVPIVTGAVLFDLAIGSPNVRPDFKMGYEACLNSSLNELVEEGNVGAGCGATVGKFLGPDFSMKGGIGTFAVQIGELIVGAIVAVNCLGDVIDPKTGKTIAGTLNAEKTELINTENLMISQYQNSKNTNLFSGNTSIGVICTNANLTKAQANKIAAMAHDGYARTMRPAHTMVDGDTIFTLATGKVDADINVIGLLASRMVEEAVIRAIEKAKTLHDVKCKNEVFNIEK